MKENGKKNPIRWLHVAFRSFFFTACKAPCYRANFHPFIVPLNLPVLCYSQFVNILVITLSQPVTENEWGGGIDVLYTHESQIPHSSRGVSLCLVSYTLCSVKGRLTVPSWNSSGKHKPISKDVGKGFVDTIPHLRGRNQICHFSFTRRSKEKQHP